MTVEVDERGRPEPPHVAGEVETSLGFLEFLRSTLGWKTEGLSDEHLHSAPLPSAMTLGGLLNHLAYVEDFWFGCVLAGRPASPPWDTVDWSADRDWDWESAAHDDGDTLRGRWADAVERSNQIVAGLSPDAEVALPDRTPVTVRWVLVHMVEEYARHCGHADLLREVLDGAVGE